MGSGCGAVTGTTSRAPLQLSRRGSAPRRPPALQSQAVGHADAEGPRTIPGYRAGQSSPQPLRRLGQTAGPPSGRPLLQTIDALSPSGPPPKGYPYLWGTRPRDGAFATLDRLEPRIVRRVRAVPVGRPPFAVPVEGEVPYEVAPAPTAARRAGPSRGSSPTALNRCPGRHYSSTLSTVFGPTAFVTVASFSQTRAESAAARAASDRAKSASASD